MPDKRFTFDRLRAKTRIAEWVGWYLDARTRPGSDQVFDYYANAERTSATEIWQGIAPAAAAPIYDVSEAKAHARWVRDTGHYVDAHCSVFTPVSLLALFADLRRLNLFPFEIDAIHPTGAYDMEFAVVLRRSTAHHRRQLTRDVQQSLAREAG